VQEEKLPLFQVALCLAVPVAVALVTIFVTWSVLMRAYNLTHVPLFPASLRPVAPRSSSAAAPWSAAVRVAGSEVWWRFIPCRTDPGAPGLSGRSRKRKPSPEVDRKRIVAVIR
jgi:hypothetical protein